MLMFININIGSLEINPPAADHQRAKRPGSQMALSGLSLTPEHAVLEDPGSDLFCVVQKADVLRN